MGNCRVHAYRSLLRIACTLITLSQLSCEDAVGELMLPLFIGNPFALRASFFFLFVDVPLALKMRASANTWEDLKPASQLTFVFFAFEEKELTS